MTRCLSFSQVFLIVHSLTLTFVVSLCTYSYAGLASFWIGREMNDKELIAKGTECKNEIEKLVVLASTWNFQNSEYQNLDVLHSLSPRIEVSHTLLSTLYYCVHRGLSAPSRRTVL